MQFIGSLFDGNGILTALFALGAVIVLIVLGVWLLKMVFNVSGSVARGRNKRLAVVDTLQIDPKRQLLIVRRDNVEHLILTGGPQDVLIEGGFPVQEPAATQTSRRPLPSKAPRLQPDTAPAVSTSRPTDTIPQTVVAVPAAQEPAPDAKSVSPIERLRDLGKPADRRTTRSLRHTGLLRPVTTQDPLPAGQNPDISALPDTDSAKEGEDPTGSEVTAFEQDRTSDTDRK